ncbi:MAG: CHASE domain-containing protein [Ignavibacteria bacterium]|nr:CHASE domain-containing protein [Ignavibacteria bacterium]
MTSTVEGIKYFISRDSIKRFWKAWLLLFAGLVVTIFSANYTAEKISDYLEESFIHECEEIKTRILLRLQAHAQVLRNGVAFFESSDTITRVEWKRFIEKSNLNADLPGIQGIGYAAIIPPSKLKEHINSIRREGFSEYSIKPSYKRDFYTSIVYLEPFTWRNQRAFGYDMFTEPTRRIAMKRARDYDVPAISEKVILVQETESDVQAGTLMYLPVYSSSLPLTTIEERRAAIKGWIYSPYRMDDLMSRLLGSKLLSEGNEIRLEVYDGETTSPDKILFDSEKGQKVINDSSYEYIQIMSIDFYGSKWTVQISKNISLFSGKDAAHIYFVLILGTLISFSIFALLVGLIEMRDKKNKLFVLATELKDSEKKYRSFVENSLVGVFQTQLDGTIKFANDAIVKLMEYGSIEEFIKENSTFYYVDQAKRIEFTTLLKREGKVEGFEIELLTRLGKHIVFLMNAVLYEDTIDGTIIEITKRKEAEKQLEQKTLQLQKTISEKDKFFSIIAHDLKSPFQGFIGITQMMAERPSDFSIEELSLLSREMNNKARNLFKLLKNLLEWARVQQGVIPFEPEVIGLKLSIIHDIETIKQLAKNKSIEIINDVDELHKVRADQNMINSICQNLLSNAIKFTHRNGKIILTSEEVDNNFIEVSVIDSGIGISLDLLNKLFKIEERVGQDGTDGEESTGLGLLLCKEFVEKNGGKIRVESIEGNGSTFSFTLPKAVE